MYEIYNVDDMDNFESIALKFDSTIDELYRINGFDDKIQLNSGMQMIVPAIDKSPYKYYTVEKGDTVYEISKKYGVNYKILMSLNGLEEDDYIYPNQTIIIPKEGLGVYMTKEDDTIKNVIENIGIDVKELMKENANIYLKPEQIIVFRKK